MAGKEDHDSAAQPEQDREQPEAQSALDEVAEGEINIHLGGRRGAASDDEGEGQMGQGSAAGEHSEGFVTGEL